LLNATVILLGGMDFNGSLRRAVVALIAGIFRHPRLDEEYDEMLTQ
jgi:hypothetical protein